MNRFLKILYPEYRYFDGNKPLQIRVQRIWRKKKSGTKSMWLLMLFVGVPLYAILMAVCIYLASKFQMQSLYIFMPGVYGITIFLIYLSRNDARRNLRSAMVQCGIPICIRCGYDLFKTDPSTPCPECGTVHRLKR